MKSALLDVRCDGGDKLVNLTPPLSIPGVAGLVFALKCRNEFVEARALAHTVRVCTMTA